MMTICNRCELMCGHLELPTAIIKLPKDLDDPLPGVLPDGTKTDDIREFCRANYIEPENK